MLGLSLTIYGIIIEAMFLVVLIVLLLCCYNFGTYHISPEAFDDFELATQPASKESVQPYCSYRPNVHVCHEISVNRKRTLTPLPNNFHNFITAIIIPSFEKQRLIDYQFAVLVLLSEKDFNNICDTTFVPSYGGQPLLNNSHPSMPHSVIHYGNYITARPISNNWHSEEEIFGSSINSPFSQLWSAYVKHNGSPPKCVLLYSWYLPCSWCTDVIIRSLNDDTYSCTSVIVAHTIFWRSESEDEHRKIMEKLKKENITVVQVPYSEYLSPA